MLSTEITMMDTTKSSLIQEAITNGRHFLGLILSLTSQT